MTRWNGGARASPRFDLGIRSICPGGCPPAHPGGVARRSAASDLGCAAVAAAQCANAAPHDAGKTVAPRGLPELPDAQGTNRLPDEVTPFVAHPGLVRWRCLGDGEPGAAEHPEGELHQAVEGAAIQAAAL